MAYGRRLVRRAFAHVHTAGTWPVHDGPSIAYVNHSAWWDAVVPFVLSHDLFRCESYAIMEGEQLAKYPFFRHLGCFGATSNALSDARAVLDYAVRLLRASDRRQRRTLWLCPQGALLGARVPLVFKSGLARIAFAVPEAPVIPVALRFEFRKMQRPECFVRVGAPVVRTGADTIRTFTRRCERALQGELDAIDAALAEGPGETSTG